MYTSVLIVNASCCEHA